jgi:hypothetical protein
VGGQAACLRLGNECDPAADEAGPQVGVEDAAPVALHLDRVDGVLDVQLVSR